ncbi:unnamed protein product [Protopolystoma xenopodis]|uniref:Uncharacterized protein n=1 Tax=Protopolystoma xenopodis TaxID=117903 RepID=A0A3S4ZPS8_9PLAT|nr:unnamed protein product [Protopolystoma xenopodis]
MSCRSGLFSGAVAGLFLYYLEQCKALKSSRADINRREVNGSKRFTGTLLPDLLTVVLRLLLSCLRLQMASSPLTISQAVTFAASACPQRAFAVVLPQTTLKELLQAFGMSEKARLGSGSSASFRR